MEKQTPSTLIDYHVAACLLGIRSNDTGVEGRKDKHKNMTSYEVLILFIHVNGVSLFPRNLTSYEVGIASFFLTTTDPHCKTGIFNEFLKLGAKHGREAKRVIGLLTILHYMPT